MSGQIGENIEMAEELAQLARLSAAGASEDIRLFLAKLVRKYRPSEPNLAAKLENALKSTQSISGRGSRLRSTSTRLEGARLGAVEQSLDGPRL